MNLKSCKCGVVLDLDSDIELHNKTMFWYYICPVCGYKIEVEAE